MKRISSFIIIIFLSFTSLFCQQYEVDREEGSIGIGYQISYPFHGLSIIAAPEMDFSFQGMFSIIGDYKSYCGKIRYHFETAGTYAYGLLGFFSYKSYESVDGQSSQEKTETVFGNGLGLGIEFSRSDIPIWTNIEIGYGDIKFKDSDSKKYAIMIGVGLHYYLPEFEF